MKTRIVNTACIGFILILFQWLSLWVPMGQALAQLQNNAAADAYQLRVIYMIPSNRSPQPGGEQKLQSFVLRMQAWYSDHMKLLGYGPKTFEFESGQDGLTPKVNIVNVAKPDTYFHGDRGIVWGRIRAEIESEGFPPGQSGEVQLVVAEIQVQLADGSFVGHFVGGLGSSFEGMGVVTGDHLGRLSEAYLTDNREYDGLLIPEIGPYPLVRNISFHWFEDPTFSSISSSAYGATIHEVGHGFGLAHDGRNDRNFNGNLMGNGARGYRGAIFTDLYPDNNTRLSTGSALLLNNSRFFNPNQTFNDDTAPLVTITSSGTVIPKDGLCQLEFTASDVDSSLAGVMLVREGNVVADMPLAGSQVSGTISTSDYVRGTENAWQLLAIDEQGNRSWSSRALITCASGFNKAPYPHIEISKSKIEVGNEVILNAGLSVDDDEDSLHLKVEWDLDGDGSFDTAPTTIKTHNTFYTEPGIYQIVARVTDSQGDASLSMPIGIIVEPAQDSLSIDKLINNEARESAVESAQLLAGSLYRQVYEVTNTSADRLYQVRVFENGNQVCNMYALDPGETKQSCSAVKTVLDGDQHVEVTVKAKVSGTSELVSATTDAFYSGIINGLEQMNLTHYIDGSNADSPGQAQTLTSQQAKVLFKIENTGDIELYRIKTYHDAVSPVNSGWAQQCVIGPLKPGQVRYCNRDITLIESGLNQAMGRAQGANAFSNPTGVINAANPTYFVVH